MAAHFSSTKSSSNCSFAAGASVRAHNIVDTAW